jgi:hypothetical protein
MPLKMRLLSNRPTQNPLPHPVATGPTSLTSDDICSGHAFQHWREAEVHNPCRITATFLDPVSTVRSYLLMAKFFLRPWRCETRRFGRYVVHEQPVIVA